MKFLLLISIKFHLLKEKVQPSGKKKKKKKRFPTYMYKNTPFTSQNPHPPSPLHHFSNGPSLSFFYYFYHISTTFGD